MRPGSGLIAMAIWFYFAVWISDGQWVGVPLIFCLAAFLCSLVYGGGVVGQSGSSTFAFTSDRGAEFIGPVRIGRNSIVSLYRYGSRWSLPLMEFSLVPRGGRGDCPDATVFESYHRKRGFRAELQPPDDCEGEYYVVVRPAVPVDEPVSVRVSWCVTFALKRNFSR